MIGRPLSLQPVDRVGRRRFANIRAKHGAEAGANRVRVVEIGPAIGDDHRIDAGRIGTAEDRADVARLFDAFQHGDDRIGRQLNIAKPARRRFGYNNYAVVAIAERELGVHVGRDAENFSAARIRVL